MNAIQNLQAIDTTEAALILARATHNKNIGRNIALICDPQTGEVRTRYLRECSPDEYFQKQDAESIFVLASHPGYSCESCTAEDEADCENLNAADEVVEQIEEAIERRIKVIEEAS